MRIRWITPISGCCYTFWQAAEKLYFIEDRTGQWLV
jgi:hypothetical protein